MRKWTALYFLLIIFSLTLCVLASASSKSSAGVNENQLLESVGKFETVGVFLGNTEKEPAEGVLEADAVNSFRTAIQERYTYVAVNSSFITAALLSFKDYHAFSKNSIDVATSYLACIYPSHNFW